MNVDRFFIYSKEFRSSIIGIGRDLTISREGTSRTNSFDTAFECISGFPYNLIILDASKDETMALVDQLEKSGRFVYRECSRPKISVVENGNFDLVDRLRSQYPSLNFFKCKKWGTDIYDVGLY